MNLYFSEKIRKLANYLDKPLYAVGGYTRNFLIDESLSKDIDLSAPIRVEELIPILKTFGFSIKCEYKRTCTVVFCDDEGRYEFTSFRREVYDDTGTHTPILTEFTEDILEDAIRRDFKCNAVYYDIKSDKFVDVLNGIRDINNKIISTVIDADAVFSHDGLRLLRLARFCGELNFNPTKEVLNSAKKNANNILDISKERIYEELKKILVCDTKYAFSNKHGHYDGIKILDEIGVMDNIFPELTSGRGMAQRSDFHNYDVLEHSYRTLLYADSSIRLSALLHDIGKPYALNKDGRYHNHYLYGEKIVREVLTRLKVDKKTIDETAFLTYNHMIDLKGDMRENKIRWFIVENQKYIDKLFLIKQADFSACKDDLSVSPSIKKWKDIYTKMKEEGVPFSIKELNINANDLIECGIDKKDIGKVQSELFRKVIYKEIQNDRAKLLKSLSFVKN